MFDLFAKALGSIAAFIFPVFASYKAIRTNNSIAINFWLMYWVVIACFLVTEAWIGFVFTWMPFYQDIRAIFMLWLVLPQFQGSTKLYTEYIHPTLETHEKGIEDFITKTHDEAKSLGTDYVKRLVAYVKQQIISGRRFERQDTPQSDSLQAGKTFAQRLLMRFQAPATAPPTKAPSQIVQSLLDMFASSLSLRVAGTSVGASLSNTNVNDNDDPGKVKVMQTRNELRNALEILDAQLAIMTVPSEKSEGAEITKQFCDQDFDHIEKSDLSPTSSLGDEKPAIVSSSWWDWISHSSSFTKG